MFQEGTEREEKTMKKSINTDNMTTFELDALIHDLRQIRSRKQTQESLAIDLENLLQLAQDEGFSLVCTTTGLVLKPECVTVFDNERRYED